MAWGQTFTGVRLEQGDPSRPGMGQAGHHTTNGLNQWTVKEGGVKGNKDPKGKSKLKGFFGVRAGSKFKINLKSGSRFG